MRAVIHLDVPDWQIGQEVSAYFPDTMVKRAICESDETETIQNVLQTDDGRSTPDEIEALLNAYGYSLNVLPRPTNKEFAYTLGDREDAAFRASKFAASKPNNAKDAIEEVFDFICHQSDVIELLIKALKVANKT